MDQLLALPVSGESFLLQRDRHHVLVDGGGTSRGGTKGKSGLFLANALKTARPHLRKLDVVVCTHADSDHAAGLASFLDHWTIPNGRGGTDAGRVGQFWLPGRWVDVLPELMRTPRNVIDLLIEEIDEIDGHDLIEDDEGTLEDMICRRVHEGYYPEPRTPSREPLEPELDVPIISEEDIIDLESTEAADDPDWLADLRRDIGELESSGREAIEAFGSARRRIMYRRRKGIGDGLARFWLGLVDTAENIRKIAEQAITHRVRIRWFDFSGFARTSHPRGGVAGFLVPINAVEQAPQPRVEASYLSRLTSINEESLVFFAPPTLRRLGVLFCGDSPLGDGPSYRNSFLTSSCKPSFPIVATAPHHGSESNMMAYGHAEDWATILVGRVS